LVSCITILTFLQRDKHIVELCQYDRYRQTTCKMHNTIKIVKLHIHLYKSYNSKCRDERFSGKHLIHRTTKHTHGNQLNDNKDHHHPIASLMQAVKQDKVWNPPSIKKWNSKTCDLLWNCVMLFTKGIHELFLSHVFWYVHTLF